MSENLKRLSGLENEATVSRLKDSTFEVSFGADSGLEGPMTIFKSDLQPNVQGDVILLTPEEVTIQIVSQNSLLESGRMPGVTQESAERYFYLFEDNVRIISEQAVTIVENDN